jgi:hypothetical protein
VLFSISNNEPDVVAATPPISDNLNVAVGIAAGIVGAAIQRRDAAATDLANGIDQTMRTMNPNNQQDVKRLEQVFDEIQAINKTTDDAILGWNDAKALFDERFKTQGETR